MARDLHHTIGGVVLSPVHIHITNYTPQELHVDSELGDVVMIFVAPSTFPPSIARDAIRAVATEIKYIYPFSLSDETVVTSLKSTAQSFLKSQRKPARSKRNRDEAVVRVICVEAMRWKRI